MAKQKYEKGRLSIKQLEELFDNVELGDDWESVIEILPNGEIRTEGGSKKSGIKKPLTLRENLGGEYSQALQAA